MQNTLPLFEDGPDQPLDQRTGPDALSRFAAGASRAESGPSRPENGASGSGSGIGSGISPGKGRSDQHLRAARRLSRKIRRYPDRSVEQTRAGLAICRHLQALLAQSEHEIEQL